MKHRGDISPILQCDHSFNQSFAPNPCKDISLWENDVQNLDVFVVGRLGQALDPATSLERTRQCFPGSSSGSRRVRPVIRMGRVSISIPVPMLPTPIGPHLATTVSDMQPGPGALRLVLATTTRWLRVACFVFQ